MRVWKNRLPALALAFVIALSGIVPALAAGSAMEEVAAQIESLPADAREYTAADRERVETVWYAYETLSEADQAVLDNRTTHPETSQPLGRVLESALWTVWSFDIPDNGTTLPDGVYNAESDPALRSEYSKGKSTSPRQKPWSVKEVEVRDGKAYATIAVESDSYSGVMLHGTVYAPTNTSGNCEFADVPVDLNSTFYFNGVSTTMPIPIAFSLTTFIDEPEPEPEPEEDADYTAVDAALAKIPSDLSVYTDESVARLTEAVGTVVRGLKKSEQDRVDAMARAIEEALAGLVKKPVRTELTVANEGDAVKVDSAFLRTENGRTELVVTLDGSDIRHLFMGTFAQAAANGDNRDNWIAGTKNEPGKREFAIPLEGTETYLPCVAISRAGLQESDDVTSAFRAWQITLNTTEKTLTAADYDETVRLKIVNHLDTFKVRGTARVRVMGDPNAPEYTQRIRLTMEDDAYDLATYTTVKNGELREVTAALSEKNTFSIRLTNTPENRCFRDGESVEIRFRVRETGDELVRQLTLDLVSGTLTLEGEELLNYYADYTAVDAALARIPADLSIYTPETAAAVEAARDAVIRNLRLSRQSEVDDMALAIDIAVASLVEAEADYAAVDAALAKIPADLNVYTDETAAAVTTARDGVVRGLKKSEQSRVDEMACAIEDAVAALAEREADYAAVDAALAKIPADLSGYTDETAAAVESARDTVVRGLKVSRQAEVDGMARAIETAVDALALKPEGETELRITNNTGMFKAVRARVDRSGGQAVLVVALSGDGYHHLYKGTYEQAVANGNDRSKWISGTKNAEGNWEFAIPLNAGESYIPCVAISFRELGRYDSGQSQSVARAFYPRQLVLDEAAGTLVTGDYEETITVSVTSSDPDFRVADTARVHVAGGPNSNNYNVAPTLQMLDATYDRVTYPTVVNGQVTEASAELGADNTFALNLQNAPGVTAFRDGEPVMMLFRVAATGQTVTYQMVIDKLAKTIVISAADGTEPIVPETEEEEGPDPASAAVTPAASAGKYVDGTYTIACQLMGEGWHNTLVSPTTLYVEDGNLYVDIVFKRVDAPLHAPRYDTLTTAYGTYFPELNEEALTCTFRRVQIPDLGYQDVATVTSAMSQPYEVVYTVFFDPTGVPLTDPSQAVDITPPDEPGGGDEPGGEDEPGEEELPGAEEPTGPMKGHPDELIIGGADAAETQSGESESGLGTAAVIAIAAGCFLAGGGAGYALGLRKRKNRGE